MIEVLEAQVATQYGACMSKIEFLPRSTYRIRHVSSRCISGCVTVGIMSLYTISLVSCNDIWSLDEVDLIAGYWLD